MKQIISLLTALILTLTLALAEPAAGGTETLSFAANPSTGYSWAGFVLGGESVTLDSAEGTYIPDEHAEDVVGAGGQTQYVLTAVKPGLSIVTFDYRRPWEGESIEQKVILASVDEQLNLSVSDVTDIGRLEGVVLSVDEAEHAVMLDNENVGEVLARFGADLSLPVEGERIVIYTDGTMTLSLPAIMNVLAWSTVPAPEARGAEAVEQPAAEDTNGLGR